MLLSSYVKSAVDHLPASERFLTILKSLAPCNTEARIFSAPATSGLLGVTDMMVYSSESLEQKERKNISDCGVSKTE
jgi:hypothetical protein